MLFSLTSVLATVALGCASHREAAAGGVSGSADDPASRSLHVVRVRTYRDSLAGIPVAANIVVASRPDPKFDLEMAVVDSIAMSDHTHAFDGESILAASSNWRLLWGPSNRFDCDPLDPALPLAVGQDLR